VIVVDTHTMVWWILEPERLSVSAASAIDSTDVIGFAAISCWEVGMLSRRNRISLGREPRAWLHRIVDARNVSILPITIEIGVRAAELHETLRDPIDCLIAATALAHNAPLITKDDRIRTSGVVETIW
jgi:PIN domain nuclease of toxin-antitoxin system